MNPLYFPVDRYMVGTKAFKFREQSSEQVKVNHYLAESFTRVGYMLGAPMLTLPSLGAFPLSTGIASLGV
jgi:hypothetical protein